MIAILSLSSVVHSAFTKFSETRMQIYLASNSAGLAQLNAPVFFLGQNSDWERLVIWYDKDPSSGMWSAEKLSMSQHGGYQTKKWNDIETTLSYAQASAANPKNRWFLSGQDHPKIFIAWDKHPHFDNKYTADLGWIAQSVNTAFRSDDWWHFVEPRYFIKADALTSAGQAMEKDKKNWGEADSFPPKVDAGVCTDPHLRGSLSLENSSLTLNLVNTTGLQLSDVVADA
ncbi:MAG: hypothetical protein ASARMPRED_006025 [Alectoria sarmentosa]|nr:MAG: hypothetical protein ASARMPRED_006025 [Alectoria sarmentosa]